MIEWLGVNRTFVVIGIFVLIGFFIPIENFVTMTKYEGLKIPKFDFSSDLKTVASGKPGQYASIKTSVFLGETPEVKPPVVVVQKHKKSAYPRLQLNAVMIDGDLRVANINGVMMEVGGRIHKHRVLKISESGVVVDGPTGRRTLTLR